MRTRLFTFALVIGFASLIACSAADKGDDCEDDGTIGGDCKEALICGRSRLDDTSRLVCMKPCAQQSDCAENETCSGDRGRIVMACRPR